MTNDELLRSTRDHADTPEDTGGHSFTTVSAHSTSEGRIAYRQCSCGLWRIEHYPTGGQRRLLALVDQSARTVTRHRNPGALDSGASLVSSSAPSASASAT